MNYIFHNFHEFYAHFRDFVDQRLIISENNQYFCHIGARPFLTFALGCDFRTIILFEAEFFRFLSNIYKYCVLAAKKQKFDENIILVEYDKVCYKLKVFNDLNTKDGFDIRLMSGRKSVLICKTHRDLVRVLLQTKEIFLSALSANS